MTLSPARLGRLVSFFALVFAALALGGCGRAVGTVKGKVTHAGKALKGGNVSFVSAEGLQSYSAGIKEDGTYTIPNITAGSYKVCVETASLKPQPLPPQMKAGAGPKPKQEKLDPDTKVPEGYTPSNMAEAALVTANARSAKLYVAIPDQYADSKTTPLTYTVVGGEQTYDIELK